MASKMSSVEVCFWLSCPACSSGAATTLPYCQGGEPAVLKDLQHRVQQHADSKPGHAKVSKAEIVDMKMSVWSLPDYEDEYDVPPPPAPLPRSSRISRSRTPLRRGAPSTLRHSGASLDDIMGSLGELHEKVNQILHRTN